MYPSGSPPRVWGIPKSLRFTGLDFRFTPTCVGNTTLRWSRTSSRTVHPHVCGEYFFTMSAMTVTCGSPPRVWGIRSCQIYHYHIQRFTPTCVGNTRVDNIVGMHVPVHPHVCGEYLVIDRKTLARNGSPPRVWGIPGKGRRIACCRRFTPTCVGNTPAISLPSLYAPVHPHVCGEYESSA